jgi:hypothetical protein
MKVYPHTHDRQLILQILCGVKDDLIINGAKALEAKAEARGLESHTLTVRVSQFIDSTPAQEADFDIEAKLTWCGRPTATLRTPGGVPAVRVRPARSPSPAPATCRRRPSRTVGCCA